MNSEKLTHNTKTAYVTNAVANSVVFYAMAYLNNKGLSPDEIKALRLTYSFENLNKRFFNMNELKNSFVNQTAFFLNLYKEMNENDRFEHFAENLEQQNRFKEIFKHYNDFLSLKGQYNRRIFHNNLECEYMRSDYNEEIFHKNTGVFSEKKILKDQQYYVIDEQYLKQLDLRLCKICIKSSSQITDESNKNVVFEFTPTSNVNSVNISLPSEVKIFENDKFIVTTDFDQFKNQMEKWLLEHPHLSEDKKLLDIISAENENHSKIDAIVIGSINKLSSRLEYRVADLLQNGLCKVFNKIKNEFVKNIEMREYNFQFGPLIGEGGRNFLADGEVFFSVEDCIS
jgi:hypothetical protein